ncbi:MAG: hypothetical protein EXS14_10390 [Planctomycetes bacterium]|nr:hypothetical protein [Planctomycetota bacterium]
MKTLIHCSLTVSMLAFVACSSTPEVDALPLGVTLGDVHGTDYLKDGPTVGLADTARSSQPTTLQLLDEKARENGTLKTRLADMEKSLAESEARATAADALSKLNDAELMQLRALLERSVTEQKALTEEVVKARIARLKLEQDMLRLKLAELARGGDSK